MSVGYQAVLWNRQKKIYDACLLGGVLLYLLGFIAIGLVTQPDITEETLVIRAFGTAAFILLHVILSIGPLSRLNPRFLPLLYNRRHMGVTMFSLALVHGTFSLIQFHVSGDVNPLVSLFGGNTRLDSVSQFPFQPLGFFALGILFVMAATSHDFWLHNLSAPTWKSIHMMVYVAYGLVVLHVALGALQAERDPAYTWLIGAGVAWVVGLHLVAGAKERKRDHAAKIDSTEGAGAQLETSEPATSGPPGSVWVCRIDAIPEKRAVITNLAGERVAVFRYDGKISAVSNACQHQNGPLGEGRIIDGCITCPWHGYQYLPESGSSPPPFTEMIPTFAVTTVDGDVWVDPRPLPPGTTLQPARIELGEGGGSG